MRGNWRIAGLLISIAAVVIVAIIALILRAQLIPTNDDGPIGEVPDDIRSLIANPPEYDCVASVTEYGLPTEERDGETMVVLTYIPNEVGTADDQRDFSDSVNVSALPAERDRVLASICSQPEETGMVGVALATKQMVGNEKLADLNPDLFGQFVNTTPKEWADKVFSGEISYADATETMTQLAGLMTIFEVTTETRATEWNFHALDAITTKADVRPIVENPTQYTGDFLVFSLTRKGQTGCWASFGINVGLNGDITKGDQRIAGFICETPGTPPRGTPPGETPPPEEECPPGNEIPECAPKPGDPDEWVGGDGINVDEGEYTGETAPEVITEETNNGVTDNANQEVGSETGGQAGDGANTHGDGGRPPAPPAETGVNGEDGEDGSNEEEISNPFG